MSKLRLIMIIALLSIASNAGAAWVQNPTSHTWWWYQAYGTSSKAVVLVPPGTYSGSQYFGPAYINSLIAKGFRPVIFDAEGRGYTGGSENQNGFVNQDGLKAVIQATAALPGVTQIGVYSQSFGLVMAAGALGRYPALPVTWLIDAEGPADRNDIGNCDNSGGGHITHDCYDNLFWNQREPYRWIGGYYGKYVRLQGWPDHAQGGYLGHAVIMLNAATVGNACFTRCNSVTMNAANVYYWPGFYPAVYWDYDLRAYDVTDLMNELF